MHAHVRIVSSIFAAMFALYRYYILQFMYVSVFTMKCKVYKIIQSLYFKLVTIIIVEEVCGLIEGRTPPHLFLDLFQSLKYQFLLVSIMIEVCQEN